MFAVSTRNTQGIPDQLNLNIVKVQFSCNSFFLHTVCPSVEETAAA